MVSRAHLVIAAVSALLFASCDRMQLTAPSESTITISASSSTLPAGGSAEVTAMVLESAGTPVQNGTTVRFSTNLGRMEPAEVQTRNGMAVSMFRAGDTSGVAQIRATSGGATGGEGDAATNLIEITVGAANVDAVVVTASPSNVPATGGTVTIVAAVLDSNGNRLPNIPISFSTTAGTLSSTVAFTDATGEARVQLTTNREATVTARAAGADATTTVTVDTPATVTIAVEPATPIVGQPVTLTITPEAGTIPRVVVDWGDGTREDLGLVPAARGAVHVYTEPGSYIITATATSNGESFSTSIAVTVSPMP